MRKPDNLRLRGAAEVLRNAITHILANPWEPDWYVDFEDGKYGHADSVDAALFILRDTLRQVNLGV